MDSAQQLKGQGQITDQERALIKRASAGDIETMTVPELRTLSGVMERSARSKIATYQQQIAPMMQNPNAAPLAPFLNVEAPAMRQPASSVDDLVNKYKTR